MTNELEGLSLHLSRIAGTRTAFPTEVAEGILTHRAEHMEALEVAGVVQRVSGFATLPGKEWLVDHDVYRVIIPDPPHEHIWHVYAQALQNEWVRVTCRVNGCTESRQIPLEIPE